MTCSWNFVPISLQINCREKIINSVSKWTGKRWADQEKDWIHSLTFQINISNQDRQRRVATQLILQADFFTPLHSAAARQRQEASALFSGGVVQAQDAAQLCRPHPLTCGRRATLHQSVAGSGEETTWGGGGEISDLYLRSPWAAGAEDVSPGRLVGQTWIPPTDGQWGPGWEHTGFRPWIYCNIMASLRILAWLEFIWKDAGWG